MTLLQHLREKEIDPEEYLDVYDRMEILKTKIAAYKTVPSIPEREDYEENLDYLEDLKDIMAEFEEDYELEAGSDRSTEVEKLRKELQ